MKFVIHYHETDIPHYDLMVDNGTALQTWRIHEDLFFDFLSGCSVLYEKIDDHRRDYLTYEGPVSCGRGIVKIADQGDYTFDSDKRIILNGQKVQGTLVFNKVEGTITLIQI